MSVRKERKVASHNVVKLTPWDNYSRHAAELKEVGATDDDLKLLRAAAQAIEDAQALAAVADNVDPARPGETLADLASPTELPNGWVINPPTKHARAMARMAVMSLTAGREMSIVGWGSVVMVGLWILKAWGDGNKGGVAQMVNSCDGLAELQAELSDVDLQGRIDDYSETYCRLMGVQVPTQKKTETSVTAALVNYKEVLIAIHEKYSSQPTSQTSEEDSQHQDSDSPGESTTT